MAFLIPSRTAKQDLDAIIVGRAGMDLYPAPHGTKTADADTFTSRKPVINYIDVYLSDGRKLTVTEDFEEFKKRIRNSR